MNWKNKIATLMNWKNKIVRGYIECALWCEEIDDDGSASDDRLTSAIHEWAVKYEHALDLATVVGVCAPDLDEWELIGHKLYLSQYEYGTGFWDWMGCDDPLDFPDRSGSVGEYLHQVAADLPRFTPTEEDGIVHFHLE